MKVSFADDDVRKFCTESRLAQRKLGAESARRLRSRLQELFAAVTVKELVAGAPHPLKGRFEGCMAVRLSGGDRLVFAPTQKPAPTRDDGSIDWSSVKEVEIVFIGDYHD
ncbi:MAG: killer suppression protein HigA [Chloroflexi bacterium]|nr:killer suppression protein HigA [Chloroflexota bacterium]